MRSCCSTPRTAVAGGRSATSAQAPCRSTKRSSASATIHISWTCTRLQLSRFRGSMRSRNAVPWKLQSLANVRTRSTILLGRSLLGKVESRTKSKALLVQYDDAAQRNLKSVAYGRRRGWLNVNLIPDPFFLETKGFETIRNAVLEGKLPPWEMRQHI